MSKADSCSTSGCVNNAYLDYWFESYDDEQVSRHCGIYQTFAYKNSTLDKRFVPYSANSIEIFALSHYLYLRNKSYTLLRDDIRTRYSITIAGHITRKAHDTQDET